MLRARRVPAALMGLVLLIAAAATDGVAASRAAAVTPKCLGSAATMPLGTNGNDNITGTAGDDVIIALGGDDVVDGAGGNDKICGGGGKDWLVGGDGNDQLLGGQGNDTIDGSDGVDTVSYQGASTGVSVNLATQSATGAGTDTLAQIEDVVGSAFGDVIVGSVLDNVIVGSSGNDRLDGNDGNDILEGGPGADVVIGNAGFDLASFLGSGAAVIVDLASGSATGNGSDTLGTIEGAAGSKYNDTLRGDAQTNFLVGGPGNDTLSGRDGTDFVGYLTQGTTGVTVNLGAGTATGQGTDTLAGDEAVLGTDNADDLTGGADDNIIDGGAGNDTIRGGEGADALFGDAGADLLYGEAGFDQLVGGPDNDTLDGGPDSDTAAFIDSPQGVNANLATAVAAGDGSDMFTAIESLVGSAYNDTLTGNSQVNNVNGRAGNDTLAGAGGDDILVGGTGTDGLMGGQGYDVCSEGESSTNCEFSSPPTPPAETTTNGATVTGTPATFSLLEAHLQTLGDRPVRGEPSAASTALDTGFSFGDVVVDCPISNPLLRSAQVSVSADPYGYGQSLAGSEVPEGQRIWEQVTLYVWNGSSWVWVTGDQATSRTKFWYFNGGSVYTFRYWAEYGDTGSHYLGNPSYFWPTPDHGYAYAVVAEYWLTDSQDSSIVYAHKRDWDVNFRSGDHQEYYCLS